MSSFVSFWQSGHEVTSWTGRLVKTVPNPYPNLMGNVKIFSFSWNFSQNVSFLKHQVSRWHFEEKRWFSCFYLYFYTFCTFWQIPRENLALLDTEKPLKTVINQRCPKSDQKPGKSSKMVKIVILANFGSQSRSVLEKVSVLTGPNGASKSDGFRQVGILGRSLYLKEAWWTPLGPLRHLFLISRRVATRGAPGSGTRVHGVVAPGGMGPGFHDPLYLQHWHRGTGPGAAIPLKLRQNRENGEFRTFLGIFASLMSKLSFLTVFKAAFRQNCQNC